MPVCWRCEHIAATAEMRRTAKKLDEGGQAYRCRDHRSCNTRRREKKKAHATAT